MSISRAVAGFAAVCTAVLAGGIAGAQDEKVLKDAIEARQGAMRIHALEVGPLFAMAKGDLPYDAENATDHANALRALLNYDETRLFLEGSSTDEMPDETLALPAIWERPDEFRQDFEDLRSAVETLAAEAGNGQEAFVAAIGPVGNACGDCHETFREDR